MRPVAAITGGTSGIGLATAKRFANGGYDVAIFGRRPERLHAAGQQIQSATDANCHLVQTDFQFPLGVASAAKKMLETTKRVDVLVNAAAVAPLAPFQKTTPEAFDEVVNVNIRSVYFLTQAIWPTMEEQGGGAIVNVSSLAAISPYTGFSAYGASKAWLDTFTKALADEGRAHGIRAFSVQPGAVATPMLYGLFPDFPPDQTVTPEQVAEVIWQLTLPPWQFSSGKAIPVTRQT